MKYSPSTHGFYDESIKSVTIPADALEVSQADYDALMKDQSEGKTIEPGPDGYPVAVGHSSYLKNPYSVLLA